MTRLQETPEGRFSKLVLRLIIVVHSDQEEMVCQESQDSRKKTSILLIIMKKWLVLTEESQDQTRLTAPAQQDPATSRPRDTESTKRWSSDRAGDEHPKTNIFPPSILSSLVSFLFVSLSSSSNLSFRSVEHNKMYFQF